MLTQRDFCTCCECQSEEIQPSVRKYFRSTVKYVITPHTPKAAIIKKNNFFCLTYKNDKSTIK